MVRLNSFCVALEYLVVCEFSIKDGPITYIKELQAFRRETPGVASWVLADGLFRKEIARLTSDERSTFTSFSQALLHVLQNCKHFWFKAKSEAILASMLQTAGSALCTPSGGGKRLRFAVHETIKVDAPLFKRGKKQAAQIRSQIRTVPAAEWSRLIALRVQLQATEKCKFFNCSLGCKLPYCKQKHVCLLCEEDHSWADAHFW